MQTSISDDLRLRPTQRRLPRPKAHSAPCGHPGAWAASTAAASAGAPDLDGQGLCEEMEMAKSEVGTKCG